MTPVPPGDSGAAWCSVDFGAAAGDFGAAAGDFAAHAGDAHTR